MKPRWHRLTTTTTTPSTVTVTLEADTSRFVEAMERAAEDVRILRYRQRLRHERSLGQAQVGVLLDQMCRDLGLNPVQTWRLPREREEQARRDGAALAARFWAVAAVMESGQALIEQLRAVTEP